MAQSSSRQEPRDPPSAVPKVKGSRVGSIQARGDQDCEARPTVTAVGMPQTHPWHRRSFKIFLETPDFMSRSNKTGNLAALDQILRERPAVIDMPQLFGYRWPKLT
jgi:hypothetical protein